MAPKRVNPLNYDFWAVLNMNGDGMGLHHSYTSYTSFPNNIPIHPFYVPINFQSYVHLVTTKKMPKSVSRIVLPWYLLHISSFHTFPVSSNSTWIPWNSPIYPWKMVIWPAKSPLVQATSTSWSSACPRWRSAWRQRVASCRSLWIPNGPTPSALDLGWP